jgi:hypothetical protein
MKILRSVLVKCFAFTSMGCFLTFTALVIALHVLHPQVNPVSQTISEYAGGPDGFLMTSAFLLRALGAICLTVGLAVGTTRSSRSWAGLVVLALFAGCSFLVALFPADPEAASLQLRIHSLSALLGFGSLAIAALVWAQRLRKEVLRRKSARASFVLGLCMLFSLVGFLVSPAGFTGLTERVLECVMILWLCFMAWQLSPFVCL